MSRSTTFKFLVAGALSSPLLWLAWLVNLEIQQPGLGLGADAGEALVHFLGEWSLIILLFAYAVSPLRRLTNSTMLLRCRRLIGLFAFAYVCLHILCYVTFYLGFSWVELFDDFVERTYITLGMAAFLCLLAMTITSTNGWQRRLRRNWQRLHQLMHVALVLALVHLWWLTKDGFDEVALFTACFAVLAAERLYRLKRNNSPTA